MTTESDSAAGAATTPATPGVGGSNNNRNNQYNRRNQCFDNNNQPNNNSSTPFAGGGRFQGCLKGREPSLKGYIYDFTGERNPDQWIKTTKEIQSYVGRVYTKYTDEFTTAVEQLTLVQPTKPNDPDPSDRIAFEVWKLEIRDY